MQSLSTCIVAKPVAVGGMAWAAARARPCAPGVPAPVHGGLWSSAGPAAAPAQQLGAQTLADFAPDLCRPAR